MSLIWNVFFSILIFTILSQVSFWLNRRMKWKNLYSHWNSFLEAAGKDDIPGLLIYSDKLIWNRYINQYQIDSINKVLNAKRTKFPELQKSYEISKNKHAQISLQEQNKLRSEFGTLMQLDTRHIDDLNEDA